MGNEFYVRLCYGWEIDALHFVKCLQPEFKYSSEDWDNYNGFYSLFKETKEKLKQMGIKIVAGRSNVYNTYKYHNQKIELFHVYIGMFSKRIRYCDFENCMDVEKSPNIPKELPDLLKCFQDILEKKPKMYGFINGFENFA